MSDSDEPMHRGMNEKAAHAIVQWWEGLSDDKGARASLRRCRSQLDVMMQPSFYELMHMEGIHGLNMESMATIAGILSHVRVNVADCSLAKMMGEEVNGAPRVSETRFKQLIRRDRGELLVSMIRLLPLIEKKANIYSIAYGVFYWGDRVKKEWVLEYYGMRYNGGE